MLTHKQAVTTQRYAHLSDVAMRRAVEESAEVITPKRNGKVIEWEIESA
ncbi:hypothetical protein [Syntrophobacter fumaroxidans]|nr:hypothetical protein [Syntrophobacter fumaroxidans]